MNLIIKTRSSFEMDQFAQNNISESKSAHRVAMYSRTQTKWCFALSAVTLTTKSACSAPGTTLERFWIPKLVSQAQEAPSASSAPISSLCGRA